MLLFTYGYGHVLVTSIESICWNIHLKPEHLTPKAVLKAEKYQYVVQNLMPPNPTSVSWALKAFKVLTQTLSLKAWKLLKSSDIF